LWLSTRSQDSSGFIAPGGPLTAVGDDFFWVEIASRYEFVVALFDNLELVVLDLQLEQRNLVACNELR
jgi:hypothetical protein